MARVDFKPDVDGFAFRNNWSFDQRERNEIEGIINRALPVAAAALTPIVMAASPAIAPIAGLALGPVLPLIALAGPFLVAAAPKIAEDIVTAVADAMVKGNGQDNLCGGMTAAALDYHCLKWVLPRGTSVNPVFDPNSPSSLESRLRKRIWDGQIESHLDNTPSIVLWKAVASVFGDWGRDWLRDRTREEIDKVDAALGNGTAVPLSLVWKSDSIGHIVVCYAVERHGPDTCTIYTYDNEQPDREVIYDIDLSDTPISIVPRGTQISKCDGILLGKWRFQHPLPAVVLSQPMVAVPPNYGVRGEQASIGLAFRNETPWALADIGPGVHSAAGVIAPSMAFASPAVPVPLAGATSSAFGVSTASMPEGWHMLEAVAMLNSTIAGHRVARSVPEPSGVPSTRLPYRVNPRLELLDPDASAGFGCARMKVAGESVRLQVNLAPVIARGITGIVWTLSDGKTATGDIVTISSIPLHPQTLTVAVEVTLADGTACRSQTTVSGVSRGTADRFQKLCELSHVVSEIPTRRIPRDLLINPVRAAARKDIYELAPKPQEVADSIQKALQILLKS
ncbi:PKD domain-containing protein [Altererythrobacter sp. Root672]|uniref:PKD domain-containing protein n=1 Tax=Altererythrobacter sp. Root672 TaxID=1736584 RepID=UPI0006F8FE44|nr:PKD domain-containing protein [Altererythrobacter sp. Root672]KRA79702.1 hypothetical protein ASD76_16895 [Altererythrobacter sp. Root672]